jgi:hypothetical protein
MILIEGPNDQLRRQVRKELRARHDRLGFHTEDETSMTLKRLIKLLHADGRYHVRERLTHYVTEHLTQGEAHMVASGLLATGSFVLVCHDLDDDDAGEYYHSTLGGLLPGMNVRDLEMVPDIVTGALELWAAQLEQLKPLLDTDIWSAGGLDQEMVMIVGDQVSPYLPCDEGRRVAFVSDHGCSKFLHEQLATHWLATGTRYYLTNAHKCDVARMNLKMLEEELKLVNPTKVVALGGVAARHLSDIRVGDFARTYHPQYWKRFKNKDTGELLEILKP